MSWPAFSLSVKEYIIKAACKLLLKPLCQSYFPVESLPYWYSIQAIILQSAFSAFGHEATSTKPQYLFFKESLFGVFKCHNALICTSQFNIGCNRNSKLLFINLCGRRRIIFFLLHIVLYRIVAAVQRPRGISSDQHLTNGGEIFKMLFTVVASALFLLLFFSFLRLSLA